MRYITLDEFCGHFTKQVLTSLTDGKAGEPSVMVLDQVNEDAASEVDDYLRGIYALPLAEPAPRTIKTITADIMKFRIYQRRDAKNLPDEIFKLYKLALDRLRDIQARKLTLDIPTPGTSENEPSKSNTVKSWNPTPKYKSHFTNFDQDYYK